MRRRINLTDIIVPKKFKETEPARWKIDRYNTEEGVVSVNNDLVLTDGYSYYLWCIENGEITCNAEIAHHTICVVGKHDNSDKEYRWRSRIDVKPGDRIIVHTKLGTQEATCVRIEEEFDYNQVKRNVVALKCEDKNQFKFN